MKNRLDFKFWIGIVISLFFMGLLFSKIDFNSLTSALLAADYRYILLAIALNFIGYFLRALRWRYLLISERVIAISSLYSATVIGYMANNLLPARLGEFVRAYSLAEQENLESPAVFASLVIDRIIDGFTVLILLQITLFTLQFPIGMEDAEATLKVGGGLMFLLYSLLVIFLFLLKRQTMKTLAAVSYLLKPFPRRVSERVIPLLGSFIGGIRLSRRWSNTTNIIITSAAIWFICLITVDITLRSFNVHLPITASMFILILLVFAVTVPASPGFIGTYHYACYKGLAVFGISDTLSVSIALVMHATGFFPVIIAGFYHLWKNKISLNEIKGAEIDR